MSALEDACRAIEQEEEERRLDNEASYQRIKELEAEVKRLTAKTRLVFYLRGGLVEASAAQGPLDNVEVVFVDFDAVDSGEDGDGKYPEVEVDKDGVERCVDATEAWVSIITKERYPAELQPLSRIESEWLDAYQKDISA